MDPDKFYSKLGASFKPGVLTTVVLAAEELKRQGKKIIGLTGGMYDEPSFPWKEVRDIYAEATEADWRVMLQYGSTMGLMPLREELCKWMKGHKIEADPYREIMITTGSQEALDLVTRVFLDPGDVVIVGAPTYLSALGAFRTVSPDIRQAKLDDDGMVPEDLERVIKQVKAEGKKLKLLYIIPSFQNPTSTMLTMERRKRILELAEKHDFLILEDNPYGYISFEEPMPTPLRGLDKSGRVMYTSTYSKIVSPGMRIGWLVAHREFISKMVEAKSNISISNALPSQWAAAKLFEKGVVDKQIEKMIKVYRKKRDVMLESMDASFPKEAKWNTPKGGLFLWVKLPEHVNATEILMEGIQRGVAYIPGSNFFTTDTHNYIRLNYSHPSIPDIAEGIQILGELLKENI
ncbi:PLP-dependent aminotransferase family protein [Candidatus Bathyarchaeota archaeon]|nr:PLP-dependent aminotransferase family protein [Candidatus Bathyarchaeota archaeon]